MPTIEQNLATWNADSSWEANGEEWSGPWGSVEGQWWGALLPRLHAFLPARSVLEIGPGRGRWSQYLKELCDELILIDLAENCIEACRKRFADDRNISYHVNDGTSLAAIPDSSIDVAFSFDSLVHAEDDVLAGYARELARTLKPDGIGFIHHSNMGALRRHTAVARALPERLRPALTIRGLVVNLYAWRAQTPTAERFAFHCEAAGLACVAQEKIAWEYGRYLTDVLSTFTPRGSSWERPNVVVNNRRFMDEARLVAQSAQLYSVESFGATELRSRGADSEPPPRGTARHSATVAGPS